MGVDLLTGGIGSGKSYDAVRQMIDILKSGRTVLTNIEGVNGSSQKKMIMHLTGLNRIQLNEQLIFLDTQKDKEKIRYFWKDIKKNEAAIIDECHKFWNYRKWKDDCNNETSEWIAESRHSGNDVLLITQAQKKLETNIRDVVGWRYHYSNLKQFGFLGSNKYTVTAYYENGDNGFNGMPKKYNQSIFLCYKSVAEDDVMMKNGILKGKNVFRHPVFLALPIIIAIFIFFLSRSSILKDGLISSGPPTVQAQESEIENNLTENLKFPQHHQPAFRETKSTTPVDDVVEKKEVYEILGMINGKNIVKKSNGIFIE